MILPSIYGKKFRNGEDDLDWHGFDPTIMCTNNEKNNQFYRKVAFLMYSERVNFRPQSWKEASQLKPHRGLGTRLPSLSLFIYI